jgi:iron complex transport system substrate-binding protein
LGKTEKRLLEEKMKKNLVKVLLISLACVILFAGCAANPSAGESAAPASTAAAASSAASSQAAAPAPGESVSAAEGTPITDMLGREVTVKSAGKIVSLAPSATEILFALGAGDNIVGVDAFSDYPEEAKSKEIVGDYNGPDVEKIVALSPDVIFCGNTLQSEQIGQMEKLGLTVVATEAVAFEDIPKSIEMIGEIMGKQDAAKTVVDSINAAVEKAKQNAPKEAPTVYYAMSYGDMGNWTSGPGSFINTMIELAGGVPITKDAADAWLEYPLEKLVSQDPDIIMVSSDMGSAEDISKVQGYSDLTAVKNGKVYQMEANVVSRPGPRIADAIAMISEILNQ